MKMNSKDLLQCLFESSSLREDLKSDLQAIIYDILDNLYMEDEIVARISDKTYRFVKDYKTQWKTLPEMNS